MLDGDPGVAAEWLAAAAAKYGVVEAKTAYAQILLDGRGVPRDPVAAFARFSVAAGAGSFDAANMVGRCHELGRGVPADPAAATHCRRSAERGVDWARYNLANLLARGAGLPRAARQGHARSMNTVGRFLQEGWAGRADRAAALDWCRRAAEGWDFRGRFNRAIGTGRRRAGRSRRGLVPARGGRGHARLPMQHGEGA